MDFQMRFPTSFQEFATNAHIVAQIQHLPIVRAIQLMTDELFDRQLNADGTRLACQKSCSFCCYQLVSVTQSEWEIIADFLSKRGSVWLKALRKRTSKLSNQWRKYLASDLVTTDPLKLHDQWLNKPCVFLTRDGSCGIYEVRPVICRIVTSTIKCISGQRNDQVRWRYEWQQWADQMTMEESAKVLGIPPDKIPVSPMLHMVYQLFHRS